MQFLDGKATVRSDLNADLDVNSSYTYSITTFPMSLFSDTLLLLLKFAPFFSTWEKFLLSLLAWNLAKFPLFCMAHIPKDCGWWTTLPDGGVQLANELNIKYGECGPVEELIWTFWELETDILITLEDSQALNTRQACSTSVRDDGNSPPRFHSFRKLCKSNGDIYFIKYMARATQIYQVFFYGFFWFITYGILFIVSTT